MATADWNLRTALKSELEFLEKGGYATPSSRRQFIFQDSPTCLNHRCLEAPKPCAHCILFELVPVDRREERSPCRHIPLDEQGQTLHSLYSSASQEMIETGVSRWLRRTIQKLENMQMVH